VLQAWARTFRWLRCMPPRVLSASPTVPTRSTSARWPGVSYVMLHPRG